MNSYEYLTELVEQKSLSSSSYSSRAWSYKGKGKKINTASEPVLNPKYEYILNAIRGIRTNYPDSKMIPCVYSYDKNRKNVVVYFDIGAEFTIGFSAHYDIVNPKTDNPFDNQASVSHLLALTERLSETPPTTHNILIVFTDGEEVGGTGAKAMSSVLEEEIRTKKLPYADVVCIINLELTACGNHYWADNESTLAGFIFKRAVQRFSKSTHVTIDCPFNDSEVFRRNKFDSSCIGMIRRSTVGKIRSGQIDSPFIWNICHTMYDLMDFVSERDMLKFTDILFSLSIDCWDDEIYGFEPISYDKQVCQYSYPSAYYKYSGSSSSTKSTKPKTTTLPLATSPQESYMEWWESESDDWSSCLDNGHLKSGMF